MTVLELPLVPHNVIDLAAERERRGSSRRRRGAVWPSVQSSMRDHPSRYDDPPEAS